MQMQQQQMPEENDAYDYGQPMNQPGMPQMMMQPADGNQIQPDYAVQGQMPMMPDNMYGQPGATGA